MAHTDADTLPAEALEALAEQVGQRIRDVADEELLQSDVIDLGESFQVWRVGVYRAQAPSGATVDLSEVVAPTNRWHHQVRFDGRAAMFARSTLLETDGLILDLQELFLSRIAVRIDEAIRWVDSTITDDCRVRLLVVPSHQLHAFWLYFEDSSQSRVLVVDAPSPSGFEEAYLYDSRQFLDKLAREPEIVGVRE